MRKSIIKNKKIGRININVRPYEIDMKEIDSLTKNEFNNNQAECVRNLLREALVRRRLVTEGKDATMSIVKQSQAEVIDRRLTPLITQIDKLTDEVRRLSEINQNLSSQVSRTTLNITSGVQSISEQLKEIVSADNRTINVMEINEQLIKLTAMVQPLTVNNSTALKNVIALRSLFYLFLFAYPTGSIGEANQLTRQQWMYFVREAQKRANKLSTEEYNTLDPFQQHKFIEDYAGKLLKQISIISQEEINEVIARKAPPRP